MRIIGTVLILLFPLALFGSHHNPAGHPHNGDAGHGHHNDHNACGAAIVAADHHEHDVLATAADLDHVALLDMQAHATRHFVTATIQPHTFGVVLHWSPGWELRWADFGIGNEHPVRIYHVTSQHDHGHRCTSHWDVQSALYGHWERVH
ncbi:MAG TPA: hypothetical protein VFO89_03230 [Thermoanaerobaculia bacterium]|nr:hypothetical protein [Thermoanaerobaculia bacterium]